MPLDLQTKLLRVLEEKQYYRLGGEKPVEVDVRVIASTNKNLEKEVEKETFRKDLYYRLNAITIVLPPLRDRKEDIPILAEHFLEKYGKELGVGKRIIADEAKETLLRYHWPGNVRELENTIKRVLVLSSDVMITSQVLLEAAPYIEGIRLKEEDSLDEFITAKLLSLIDLTQEPPPNGIYDMIIRRVEKPLIEAVLKITKGNKKKAAHILGINRNTLAKKLEDFGIHPEDSN
jgi:two-component system nitrogen regulation response regulator GlnG